MSIYLFDKMEKLVDIVERDTLIEWTHTVQVNAYEQASFELPVDYDLSDVDYFGFFHTDETFKIFRITEKKRSDVYYVEGIDKAESDLRTVAIIKDRRPQNATADQALVVALEGTGYELGTVSGLPEVRNLSYYYISPSEALTKIIETYGCEFRVRYTFIENRITSRYIDLAKRFGKVSGKQFLYGDNALSIEHEETADDVVTALIGRGKGEETVGEDGQATGGYGRRIEFTDIVWSKKNGKPIDKPAGQNYVVSETARQAYGLSQNGQLKHRWGVFVDENIDDKGVLLQRTYEELLKLSVPITTFKASILAMNGEADYGDSVAIIRDEIGIAFEARLHKVVYDKLDSDRTTVELGDYATLQARQSRAQANKITEAIDDAMASVSANIEAFNRMIEEKIATKNAEIDDAIRVAQLNMDNALELAKVNAENYANNVKSQIDAEFDAFEKDYEQETARQNQAIENILVTANTSTNLAQEAKRIGEQAKTDAASALAKAIQAKYEAIADAKAQVATVNQALNTAKTDLQSAIDSVDQKARENQASANAIRNDLNLQSAKILEQARAQTDLTNRLTTAETTANSTKTTVTELSKTVDKATGDITSVSNRTKVVEDGLAGVKTSYTQLNQTVNTQTGQIDSINRKTADLQSGIDGVMERFENIKIGGSNYIKNASFLSGTSNWVQEVDSNLAYNLDHSLESKGKAGVHMYSKPDTALIGKWKGIRQDFKIQQPANTEYALSLYLAKDGLGTDAEIAVHFMKNNEIKQQAWFKVNKSDIPTTYKRFIFKAKSNFDVDKINVMIYVGPDAIANLYVTDVQFEVGNIISDFQLSDEDLRSEFAIYVRNAQESSADLSRRIETADGKAVDAKAYAQQTAEGFKSRIESLESYKNTEGTRAEQYLSASRTETAKQLSAERTAIANNYVAKSAYTEDVRGTTQKLTEIKSTSDTTKQNLANYQTTVDRKLTELTSSTQTLDGKINLTSTKIDTEAGKIRTELSSVEGKIPTSVSHRNLIPDTSDSWSAYQAITSSTNWVTSLGTVKYGDVSGIYAGSKVHLYVHVSADDIVFDPNVTNRSMLLQGRILNIQSDWTWTDWNLYHPFYNKWSSNLNTGNNYRLIKLTTTVTQEMYHNSKGFEITIRIDGVKTGNFHIRALMVTTGDIFPAYWTPSIKDFATAVAFNRVEDTVSSHTRTIADQVNSISQVIQTSNGILSRVGALENNSATKSALSATQTEVSQLTGSYAIRNLTSAGTLISGINLGADGVNRFDGRLTHITGQTLIDNAVIKSAMVDKLKTANFESGSVTTQILGAEAVTADKLRADEAFFNKLTAGDALIQRLTTKELFATRVQSIDLSADRVTSGILRSQNGATSFNLNDGSLNFHNDSPAIRRSITNLPNQFVKFATSTEANDNTFKTLTNETKMSASVSVTSIGTNRSNGEQTNDGSFTGINIYASGPATGTSVVDRLGIHADLIIVSHSVSEGQKGWVFENHNASNNNYAIRPMMPRGLSNYSSYIGTATHPITRLYSDDVMLNGHRLKGILKDLANLVGKKGGWAADIS